MHLMQVQWGITAAGVSMFGARIRSENLNFAREPVFVAGYVFYIVYNCSGMEAGLEL